MKNISNIMVISWLLRIGLVIVFLYASISALMHPLNWEGFVPNFLAKEIAADTVIKVISVYELVLVIWLLSGKYIKYCGLLCALTFAGIILFNISQLITTFRDIGLMFMAAALYFTE